MAKVGVYDWQGNQTGEIDLPDEVFGVAVNEALIHQAAVMYAANRRQGTADTKTRAEVSGGGRKPWRQKGTGRARQGSIRAPQWRGGGVVFGPHPRSYRQDLPKKARKAALRSALSAKLQSGQVVVIEDVPLKEPKTREVAGALERLQAAEGALFVTEAPSRVLYLSTRNLPGVGLQPASDLNVYDVLSHRKLVFTRDAVAKVGEVLGSGTD